MLSIFQLHQIIISVHIIQFQAIRYIFKSNSSIKLSYSVTDDEGSLEMCAQSGKENVKCLYKIGPTGQLSG